MKQLPYLMLFALSLTGSVCANDQRAMPSKELNESGVYSPIGKRDPFKTLNLDVHSRELASPSSIEKFGIDRFQLKAILRYPKDVQAMFEDPEGRSFILREGDTIGRERGTLSRILNSEVIVTERTYNYLGEENLYERVLALPDESTIDQSQIVRGHRTTPITTGQRQSPAQIDDLLSRLNESLQVSQKAESAEAPAPVPPTPAISSPNSIPQHTGGPNIK